MARPPPPGALLAPAAVLTRPRGGRAVLRSALVDSRRSGDRDYRLDNVEQHGDRVVVSFSWVNHTGRRHHWTQALRIREGRIVDMQDYRSPKQAVAVARLRAAFG
jgi:hypothetical protein